MQRCIAILFFFVSVALAGARDVTVRAAWSLDSRPGSAAEEKPHFEIVAWDQGSNSLYKGFHFRRNDPAVRPENFSFVDENKKPIPFTMVLKPASDAEGPASKRGLFRTIKLYPKGPVPKKASVAIKEPFDLVLEPGDKVVPYTEKQIEPPSGVPDYASGQTRNKFAIKAGNSAAVSFEAEYFREWPEAVGAFHLGVKGDTSLGTATKGDYFDNLEAFAKVTYGDYIDRHRGILLWELITKTEADRGFDVVNQTVGFRSSLTWNNALFKGVNEFFVGPPRAGNPWREDYMLPPLIALGYDYVAKIERDSETSPEIGNHRIVARLLWTIPLVRGWKVPDLIFLKVGNADQRLNMDLVTDFEGIYDISADRFSPKLKVDLDFYLMAAGERPPAMDKRGAFVLSFANGEAAPRFEHVNEFLAGFKYLW